MSNNDVWVLDILKTYLILDTQVKPCNELCRSIKT